MSESRQVRRARERAARKVFQYRCAGAKCKQYVRHQGAECSGCLLKRIGKADNLVEVREILKGHRL